MDKHIKILTQTLILHFKKYRKYNNDIYHIKYKTKDGKSIMKQFIYNKLK
jgi:hypothetical protein